MKVPRVGYLSSGSAFDLAARIEAFRQGLRELGYVEGKNIVIEWREAKGNFDRVRELGGRTSAPQDGCHRLAWPGGNPSPQGSNFDNSHCHERRIPIRSAAGSSPAWRDRVGTSLDWRLWLRRWAANNWSF